jgi:hypothetical protein
MALAPARSFAQTETTGPMNVPPAPATQNPETQRLPGAPDKPKDQRTIVNGRPYQRPTPKEQFDYYMKDTYGLPALARTSVRVAIAQGRDKPEQWGQDWPGFGQRFGSSSAVTVIDGNVRYALGTLLKEDLRYIPCHGCSKKRKIENALLAEITARHDSDGHRFFTLTPTITDMAGPLVANSIWVPGHTTIDGFVGSRLIFATRIGSHLFTEFVWERRHHDPKLPD